MATITCPAGSRASRTTPFDLRTMVQQHRVGAGRGACRHIEGKLRRPRPRSSRSRSACCRRARAMSAPCAFIRRSAKHEEALSLVTTGPVTRIVLLFREEFWRKGKLAKNELPPGTRSRCARVVDTRAAARADARRMGGRTTRRRARAAERGGAPRSRARLGRAPVRRSAAEARIDARRLRGRTIGRTIPSRAARTAIRWWAARRLARRSPSRCAARSTSPARRRSRKRTAARCTAPFEAAGAPPRSSLGTWAHDHDSPRSSTRFDGSSRSRCSSRSSCTVARSTGAPRGPRFAPPPGPFSSSRHSRTSSRSARRRSRGGSSSAWWECRRCRSRRRRRSPARGSTTFSSRTAAMPRASCSSRAHRARRAPRCSRRSRSSGCST